MRAVICTYTYTSSYLLLLTFFPHSLPPSISFFQCNAPLSPLMNLCTLFLFYFYRKVYRVFTLRNYSRESVIRTSIIRLGQLIKHLKSCSSTCKHTQKYMSTPPILSSVIEISVCIQLSELFTNPNTPWSQCVLDK